MRKLLNNSQIEIKTPIGYLRLTLEDDLVTSLVRLKKPDQLLPQQHTYLQALEAYFQDPSTVLTIPVKLQGTDFQIKVWRALQNIPAGKTMTYGELALRLNTSARAIGQACRTNKIPVIIPCHRVVARNHLGGYSGETSGPTWQIKQWLINWEQSVYGT